MTKPKMHPEKSIGDFWEVFTLDDKHELVMRITRWRFKWGGKEVHLSSLPFIRLGDAYNAVPYWHVLSLIIWRMMDGETQKHHPWKQRR